MAEQHKPEKPQFDYFRMKKAYYELAIHQELGLASHSLFLALLHKANDLHFRRFFRISGKELADLAVLSERGARMARNRLVQFTIQNLPLVLYWEGHRGRSPTYAIIYEHLDLFADYEQIGKKIEELRAAMFEIEELNAAKVNVDNSPLAESNAANSDLAESNAAKDSGTSFRYPPLSGIDSGMICRDHNKLLGSINTPLPINDISRRENGNENEGEEGGGIFSKREKTEEEIQDVVANLAQHGVKNKGVATQIAKTYTTSFIYRHIMQIKHDHRDGQRWNDAGGILVSRIRKGDPTPDFSPEDYPESAYENRFGDRNGDGIPE